MHPVMFSFCPRSVMILKKHAMLLILYLLDVHPLRRSFFAQLCYVATHIR
jgi:hypothetical protein